MTEITSTVHYGNTLTAVLELLQFIEYGHGRTLQEAVRDEYGVDLPSDVANALMELDTDVRLATPGGNVGRLSGSDETNLGEVLARAESDDGEVYMAVTPNQQTAEVVWDMGRDGTMGYDESTNYVIQLENSKNYETYKELFGWKELRSINIRSLHEYPISNELYEDLMAQMGVDIDDPDDREPLERADPTPPDEEELNVSVGRDSNQQEWILSQTIRRNFLNDEPVTLNEDYAYRTQYPCDVLILFPVNSEHNISDHYWLGGNYGETTVGLANCNVGTYNYLKDVPGVYHIDTLVKAAWRLPITTNKGVTTVAHARDDLVLHVVSEEAKGHFQDVQTNVPKALIELCEKDHGYFSSVAWDDPDADEMYYAPITQDELFELLPAIRQTTAVALYGDLDVPGLAYGQKRHIRRDVWVYARARLHNWELDSIEMEKIISYGFDYSMDDGGYELVETIAYRHDAGLPPTSKS